MGSCCASLRVRVGGSSEESVHEALWRFSIATYDVTCGYSGLKHFQIGATHTNVASFLL